jgi:oxygen-independent coproporphyrinogen-3 oxidase
MADYAAACRTELLGADLPPATSVFFGGGTPSLIPAELLISILDAVTLAPGAEVTVECNPDTVSLEQLAAYRRAGVTRLSFGVQSMVPHVLASLGREHDVASVRRAAGWAAEAGFETYSVDLIFGAVAESDGDWRATLDAVLALDPPPPHVSAYALTVEAGTPLAKDPARHPDDDVQATRYLLADEVLSRAGLASYEISNWARPGHECKHNLLYWSQGDYRGIGCAAHSHASGRRWWNIRTPERYIAAITEGRSPVAAAEDLDIEARTAERLQLALRTRWGVPAAAVPDDPDLDGLVWRHDGRAGLTAAGRLLGNEVATRLVVPASPRPEDSGH